MRNPIHLLSQQITGKSTLEECSLDEVKRIAQRYPYFSSAQFLLLQKLRQSNRSEEAEAQYKKAVLFYPDPAAFEVFISSGKFYTDDDESAARKRNEFTESEENKEGEKTTDEALHEQLASPSTADKPLTNTDAANGVEVVDIAGILSETSVPNAADVDEVNKQDKVITEDLSETLPFSGGMPVSPASIKEGVETNNVSPSALTFEPYHTVDYFASQGIKISSDELQKDKLGKQLKSFTAWLKTMKRLPASEAAVVTQSFAERGVESMADRSVTQSEVLTEAMAEVWAKQGAPDKALDIYNKLSLYNPSKRDYFAAKIESLKQS